MSIEKIAAAATPYSLAIGNAISGGTNGKILNITAGLLGEQDPYSLALGNAIGGNVSGGILFGNSANNLAQNSTKLFWDQTNERLGLGIAASLLARLHVKGSGATNATSSAIFTDSNGIKSLEVKNDNTTYLTGTAVNGSDVPKWLSFNGWSGENAYFKRVATSTVGIKLWSTNDIFTIDGGIFTMNTPIRLGQNNLYGSAFVSADVNIVASTAYTVPFFEVNGGLSVKSTTTGFLPPRMTTLQKNAIVTPAAGLMVYDKTLNKLCVFTTVWETVTSL